MPFGNKISTILGERRESIREFSRNSGIAYPTCHDLYHAKTKQITWDLLDRLCKYFGVGPWELFPYTPEKLGDKMCGFVTSWSSAAGPPEVEPGPKSYPILGR